MKNDLMNLTELNHFSHRYKEEKTRHETLAASADSIGLGGLSHRHRALARLLERMEFYYTELENAYLADTRGRSGGEDGGAGDGDVISTVGQGFFRRSFNRFCNWLNRELKKVVFYD